MPKAKGSKKSGGRVAGTPNKLSMTVKDNVVAVFNKLGGVENMVTWASDNQTEFYKLYSKLLPTEVEANVDGKLIIEWKKE